MPLRPVLPPALRNTALFGQIRRGRASENEQSMLRERYEGVGMLSIGGLFSL
jgi:hypothetical protein